MSEAMPRVAVVVACFDSADTLPETLESLGAENGIELVVVDDGSSDGATLALLETLEAAGTTVVRKPNGGPASAWMSGIAHTNAPYVMPFSSDDLLVPGATARLADALDASPRAAVAWGDMESFGATRAYHPAAPALCPWHVTFTNPIPAIALFRRSVLLRVGGWRGRGFEDWDLWLRLAAAGEDGVHVATPVYRYRRDASGLFVSEARRFDEIHQGLVERNRPLFERRAATRRVSPAPLSLKAALPLVDRLPFASRKLRVQLAEALTVLLWSGGVRRTTRIVREGIVFRLTARRRARS